MTLPAREEHRCLVTDGLYSFPVTSRHKEQMTQRSFHLVNFILPSSQVAGLSCDKMFSFSIKRRLQISMQTSWGCKEAEQRGAHPKLKGGLCTCCECLWEEGLETGRLHKGRKLPVSCKPWGSWGLTSGSYRHLPVYHHPVAIHLLPALLMLQYLPRCWSFHPHRLCTWYFLYLGCPPAHPFCVVKSTL